jgi:hypothetical protein
VAPWLVVRDGNGVAALHLYRILTQRIAQLTDSYVHQILDRHGPGANVAIFSMPTRATNQICGQLSHRTRYRFVMAVTTGALDFTALTEPITRKQVIAFRRGAAKSATYSPRLTPGQAIIGIVIVAAVTVGVLSFMEPVFWPVMQEDATMFWLLASIPILVLGGVTGVCIYVLVRAFSTHRTWQRWMRLDRFAHANGLRFRWQTDNPVLPGFLFSQGGGDSSYDQLTGDHFEFGDFSYLAGGPTRVLRKHRWGYLAVRLTTDAPRLFLRAHSTSRSLHGMSLPLLPHILSPDGDFGRIFSTSYADNPDHVLQFLTPSLMASLIDNASDLQIEVVNGWLFYYSARPFKMDDPVIVQRMLRLAELTG